ncbi:hypothetical protein GE09DRAFT_473270 [Coniochaeta sp. 2T2.1]|nr:hypothetical protein GE09DRAFT_473270 [Coniochaeta sp. 2T2.1]
MASKLILLAAAAGLPAVLSASISPPRSDILGRQTTAFVNVFKGPGCASDDFLVALAVNKDPIAGPENCVEHRSADEIPETQQDDGSYMAFIQPTGDSIFNGAGQVIVRSPVQVDLANCGNAASTLSTEGCFGVTLADTFFLQGCLKSDDRCVPHNFVARQDPGCFQHGDKVSKLDTQQTKFISQVISCSTVNGCHVENSYEQSVTNTVSVSVSAGVEGLFSATMGYEYSQQQSYSTSYTFDVPAGQSGRVTWTPILECYVGKTSGCGSDIPDGDLEMCGRRQLDDGSYDGVVGFVNQD